MPTSEIILVNLGTPAAPTAKAVRAFLAEFLADPMVVEKPRWLWLPILHGIILRKRPAHIQESYKLIWTPAGSPLAVGTEALATAVGELCPGVRVTHAYRYGPLNIAARLAESRAAHPDSNHPIHVVPLFPQRTASSTETVVELVKRLAQSTGLGQRLKVARIAPTAPGYITALADSVRANMQALDPAAHLLVTFHGIPLAVNERENQLYTKDCEATFEALLRELELPPERASLTYQSPFRRDPWLGPDTEKALAQLGSQGKSVVVCTPGFLTAALETLEELGMRGQAAFREAGGKNFALAPTPVAHDPVAVHPSFAADIAALLQA